VTCINKGGKTTVVALKLEIHPLDMNHRDVWCSHHDGNLALRRKRRPPHLAKLVEKKRQILAASVVRKWPHIRKEASSGIICTGNTNFRPPLKRPSCNSLGRPGKACRKEEEKFLCLEEASKSLPVAGVFPRKGSGLRISRGKRFLSVDFALAQRKRGGVGKT